MNLYVKYIRLIAMQIIFPHSFALTNAAKALLFITVIQLFQHIVSVALFYYFKADRSFTDLNLKVSDVQKRQQTVPFKTIVQK